MWCIPELTRKYVTRMEDLLLLYERPYNATEPVVCLDEKSVQCLTDKRKLIRVRNGSVRRDYEYVRNGTANVFCAVEPRAGRHFTKVTKKRKNPDFARMLRDIARAYPRARTIHLVVDNLSTHTKKALTDTFSAVAAEKLWSRFTVHYTPTHASWLNQAEIEISVFSTQCLGKRRISSIDELTRETAAWRRAANRRKQKIRWTFTVRKARKKFGYRKVGVKFNLSGN